MTETVAPQEDRLQLPAAWTSRLLPRRGKRNGKPVVLDPGAPALRRQKIAARTGRLRAALDLPENAEYAAAGNAFLDGKADPAGAAAVAALSAAEDRRSDNTSCLRPDLDLWIQEYGLPFAFAAAVERLPVYSSTDEHRVAGAIAERVIRPYALDYPYLLMNELRDGGITALRSLLADLPDDEYAAVLAEVAGHRDTGPKRLVAALLFPDQTAWVLEACTDYAAARTFGWSDILIMHTLSEPAQLAAAGLNDVSGYYTDAATVAALVDGLGTDALPVLAATLDTSDLTSELRKLVLRAISLLPSDDAVEYLLRHLDRPHVFEPASDAAARFPVRTLRAALRLTETAPAGLRPVLTAIAVIAEPQGREHLSDDERATLDALLTETVRVPEATAEELPQLLVAPPWTLKRPNAKPVVIDGLRPPSETHLLWAPGEQREWSELWGYYSYDEAYWDRYFAEETPRHNDWRYTQFMAYGPHEKAAEHLKDWIDNDGRVVTGALGQRLLARFGEPVIDRLLDGVAKDATSQDLPGPILNTAAARIAAERLDRLKSTRLSAAEWFERHGLDTVAHLVPDALGADKKRRRYAETALAHLSIRHGQEAIVARAEQFGPEAAAAIGLVVGGDPLTPRGVKVPKPAAWASPVMLPQVLLAGGERALPAESIPHLITVLALATPDYPYAGLDVVAETCDRASLSRFGKALFEQWLAVGAPPKDGWALTQLAHFAEDETVWMLAPKVREWPGQSQHKRAVTGLEVLGAIGSEEALRAIQGIADKVKFKALKEEASRQIQGIAQGLGLSREQLADRLVPDFGLGEDAALTLDYGPRSFTVAFDEHLKPFVVDDTGKARKALPKPGAKDDPELAEASYKRFGALKKELRNVAADQVGRLESAMVGARTWSVEEFRRFFADHALTRHLARRLVWLAEDGDARFGFRIAEDGTFSDVEDDALDLPENATIRVAHPVHLEREEVEAWAEVLADYEILQPFDQLTRPIMTFTEEELATGHLTRFEGVTVDVGRILGMAKRGWRRAAPEDAGMEPGFSYELPGGGYVMVGLEPGIYAGAVAEFPEQKLESVRLTERETYWAPRKDEQDWRDKAIDPVTASEVLAALTRLTSAS
ncbi:DUF4132 domain-containing protein [Glycomyces sp. NRRL B-16210]|uniref:DUF4132 domain-containing protein n=1 Tax=Glycomyces sp. NRRL B-16210 TaxID=1463821 RepID=UPI00068CB957|nr:DUF4132 domain-containing protein [Glycomyces sp. NRRL B-16210]